MLDLKYVLNNLEEVREGLGRRGVVPAFDTLVDLDRERRRTIVDVEALKKERNESSKKIGEAVKSGQDVGPLRERVREIGDRIKALDEEVTASDGRLREIMLSIPNIPHSTVPTGADEQANRVERVWGSAPRLDFTPRDHVELGELNGLFDFERAAKMTGARFTVLTGRGARLERALINFMLDLHTECHGYREMAPPFMVNDKSLLGTGQLPKFEQDLFRLREPDNYFLVPTAEVPLTNFHAEEILDESQLPLRYTGYTPCFRSEAGSYGKDVRGMIRQHQFSKVELVSFATPETSYDVLEQLTGHAEEVLKRLGLHHRVVCLSSGDMGFSSAKTYDLEVWLPSQDCFREISSCSNCEDFQARRANIRYRPADGGKVRFAHTLNGSGLAVGRTLVALLENYQRADGSFDIPEVLRPYLEARL